VKGRLTLAAIAGWLFADLLLAFAIVMLGTQEPPPRPARTPAPTPSPGRTRLALDRGPVQVELSVNPDAAGRGDASAIESIRRAVRAEPRLRGRRAGIVLTFGAEHSGAEAFANDVNALLERADPRLFGDVATRDMQLIGASGGAVLMSIYLFYDD
jgi:hypothetical protein